MERPQERPVTKILKEFKEKGIKQGAKSLISQIKRPYLERLQGMREGYEVELKRKITTNLPEVALQIKKDNLQIIEEIDKTIKEIETEDNLLGLRNKIEQLKELEKKTTNVEKEEKTTFRYRLSYLDTALGRLIDVKNHPGSNLKVLDIGVSPQKEGAQTTEAMFEFLKPHVVPEIVAIDKKFPMSFNPENKKIRYKVIDITKEDIKPLGNFDVVRIKNVLEWLDDPKEALEKVKESVREGGLIIYDDFVEGIRRWPIKVSLIAQKRKKKFHLCFYSVELVTEGPCPWTMLPVKDVQDYFWKTKGINR